MISKIKFGVFGTILLLLLLPLSVSTSVSADKGMISLEGVNVYEPGQKAIIGWDGLKEVLILSTDAYSTQSTSVLEVMPFPSKPTIERGSFESFKEIQKLATYYASKAYGEKGVGNATIDIIFHKKIGAHNITLIQINSVRDFDSWLDNFLDMKKVDRKVIPTKLSKLITEYFNGGMKFFVFDEISLSSTMKSVDPIVYMFESSYLYYPLRISTVVKGYTTITLFTITDFKLDDNRFSEFKKKLQVRIYRDDVIQIDERFDNLSLCDRPCLTVYRYEGSIEVLNTDIKAGMSNVDITPFILIAIVAYLIFIIIIVLILKLPRGRR